MRFTADICERQASQFSVKMTFQVMLITCYCDISSGLPIHVKYITEENFPSNKCFELDLTKKKTEPKQVGVI